MVATANVRRDSNLDNVDRRKPRAAAATAVNRVTRILASWGSIGRVNCQGKTGNGSSIRLQPVRDRDPGMSVPVFQFHPAVYTET